MKMLWPCSLDLASSAICPIQGSRVVYPAVTGWSAPNPQGLRARASSVGGVYIPYLAIDNSTLPFLANGTCMHTQEEGKPWLALDLGSSKLVTGLTVYPRSDICCARKSS